MSQHRAIVNYLRTGEVLTVLSAIRELGVYALSQRIGEIKRKNMLAPNESIGMKMMKVGKKHMGVYWLERKEK